jgi:hypothetical protein
MQLMRARAGGSLMINPFLIVCFLIVCFHSLIVCIEYLVFCSLIGL